MRRLIGLSVLALSMLVASSARADGIFALDALYIDARAHVFTDSDVRSAAGFPVGLDGEAQFDLAGNLDLSASLALLYGLSGDFSNYHFPALLGAVYNINEGSSTPFVSAGFGIAITKFESVDTETNGAFELGGGYEMGGLRVKASLFFFDTGHLSDTMSLMASVGYSIR